MNRRTVFLLCVMLSLGLAGCVIADEGGYRRGDGRHEDRREFEERGEREEGERR